MDGDMSSSWPNLHRYVEALADPDRPKVGVLAGVRSVLARLVLTVALLLIVVAVVVGPRIPKRSS